MPRYAWSAPQPTSGPTPVTARTRPPSVTNLPSSPRRVPAWNTAAPGSAAASSTPVIGRPFAIAARIARRKPPPRWPPRRRASALAASSQSPLQARLQDIEQVALQQRQDHLRLGVAKAAVELQHPRPVGRQHQAGVEHAGIGDAFTRACRPPSAAAWSASTPARSRRSPRARAHRRPCRRCSGPGRRRRARL